MAAPAFKNPSDRAIANLNGVVVPLFRNSWYDLVMMTGTRHHATVSE